MMLTHIRRYVLLVGVAAMAAATAVFIYAPQPEAGAVEAAILLAAFAVIAELLMYMLPRGAAGSIAFIPLLAISLISPSWVAVAAVGGSHLIAQIVLKKAPVKVIFNTSQYSLAISLGIIAYLALGGRPLPQLENLRLVESAREMFLPFAVVMVVFFIINTFAVSGAIAASENRDILQVWKQNTLSSLLYDILCSPVVFLLAWLYVKFGPIGAASLAIPLMGVRQLYKTNLQLEQVNQDLLQLMVKAIEARDPYTSGHSRRVAHYSKIIARAMGLGTRQVNRVGVAALLHDVGKIHEIYAPILRKPDKLTPDEWAIMQTHPIKSAELVETVSHLKDLVAPLRHHHENWDGSGYPDGIAGEAIPLESRIIIFADTIDAMTTDRPYRKALGEKEVREELIKHRERQFDPRICDALLSSPMFDLLFAPGQREPTPIRSRAVTPARSPRIALRA